MTERKLLPFERHEPGMPADEADDLLRGLPPTKSASSAARAVGGALGFLTLPPSGDELADERAVVASFAVSMAQARQRAEQDTPAVVTPLRLRARRGFRVAVAAATGSLVLGGVAAAAFTGVLPGPLSIHPPAVTTSATSTSVTAAGSSGGQRPHVTASASSPAQPMTSAGGGVVNGLAPTTLTVCRSIVGHPAATPTAASGAVAQILASLQATAAADGQTVAQLCTDLLNPTAGPTPSGSGAGLGGLLPLPTMGSAPAVSLPALPAPPAPGSVAIRR